MIVLDASVVVALLIRSPSAELVRAELTTCNDIFLVPHLIDVEVLSALRRLATGRRIDVYRFEEILAELSALPAERVSHIPFLARIWQLRHNFTSYDAAYIALAEAADATLYTMDTKLAEGHRAKVRVLSN